MRVLAGLVVLAVSAPALAQAPGEVAPTPPDVPAVGARDPQNATLISIGVTAGSLAVLTAAVDTGSSTAALVGAGALLVGPSTGRWYAGELGGGSLLLRATGGVAMVYGLTQILGAEESDCIEVVDCTAESRRAQQQRDTGSVFLFGGLGLWVGTSIYDMVMAYRDTETWNHRHALRVKPTMISSAGHHAIGLALDVRF